MQTHQRVLLALCLSIAVAQPCSRMTYPMPMWEKNPLSSASLFRFVQDDKVGFIDVSGHVVIPPELNNVAWGTDDFSEGLLHTEANGVHSFLDEMGKLQLSTPHECRGPFSEGLISYYTRIDGKSSDGTNTSRHLYGYLDRTGAIAIEAQFGEVNPFSEGLASVRKEAGQWELGLAGYADQKGQWMIPPRFAMAGPFQGGLAVVVKDGFCQFGEDWPLAAPAVPTRSSCGDNQDTKERCQYGVIDRLGNYVVQPSYDFIRDYSEGFAAIRKQNKWGFIDKLGRVAIEPQFDIAASFSDGLAAVRLNGKWGFIAGSGVFVVQPRYTAVGRFAENRAPVSVDAWGSMLSWGYIDRSGSVVIPPAFKRATAFARGLAGVQVDKNKFSWIRPDGTSVLTFIDDRRSW